MAGAIEIGQRFDFISASGDRREYEVKSSENPDQVPPGMKRALGPAANVKLRNLAGGGIAQVTMKWLSDPPGPSGSYWEAVAE